MSYETQDEERTIQALIEALERQTGSPADGDPVPRIAGGEAGEALARLSTEVLGLLPYALDPVAPPPALRQRLMAIVTGEETQASPAGAESPALLDSPRPAPAAAPSERPISAVPAAPQRPARPAATPSGSFPTPYPSPPSSRLRPRPRRWPLALAASLVLALLGVSAWQFRDRERQSQVHRVDQAEIAQLSGELKAERQRSAEVAAARSDRDRLRAQVGDLEKTFSLVTSPTVEMSALRPTGQVALARQAHGRIYIAEDHQHWYLSVQDLAPSGAGREYQLWFFGDQGPVSGGRFTAAPGEPVQLSSEHMPLGTKAIVITLEPASGAPAPSGPEVLRAMPPVKIL